MKRGDDLFDTKLSADSPKDESVDEAGVTGLMRCYRPNPSPDKLSASSSALRLAGD